MKVTGNERPLAISFENYPPKPGHVLLRMRENVQEKDGGYVYDEYTAVLKAKPNIEQDVQRRQKEWLTSLKTISMEQNALQKEAADRKLNMVTVEGAALAQASAEEPTATVGVLVDGFPKWEPGAYYEKRYSLFEHKGDVYFTRQPNITAYAHQEPGTTGMESVYGIRPVPDDEGVYPYRYNMAASVGMKVREGETVYECYQAVDPMLWPPSQISAHFRIWEP